MQGVSLTVTVEYILVGKEDESYAVRSSRTGPTAAKRECLLTHSVVQGLRSGFQEVLYLLRCDRTAGTEQAGD